MKKMMMVFVVLFAMVGSSFGNGILPGFYNVYSSATGDGWSTAGCVKIKSIITTESATGHQRIVIRTDNGVQFEYISSNTAIDEDYKVLLSQIMFAINTKALVNPYVTSTADCVYFFNRMIIHQ